MKKLISILFFGLAVAFLHAQQGDTYSQFLMNNYIINPAVGGMKTCQELTIGNRSQWVSTEGAPVTSYVSFHSSINKLYKYKTGWHGVGGYVIKDDTGPTSFTGIYPSYTYHLRIKREYILAMGVFLGIRNHRLSGFKQTFIDPDDPVLGKVQSGYYLPEVAPGLWLYKKDFYAGFSVKQLYVGETRFGGKDNNIKINRKPHYYLTVGKSIEAKKYYYTYVPAVHVRFTELTVPSVDLQMMFFVKRKYGLGAAFKSFDTFSGMVYFRLFKKLRFGYNMEYNFSKIRHLGPVSHEVVLSFTVCPEDVLAPASLCPAYN